MAAGGDAEALATLFGAPESLLADFTMEQLGRELGLVVDQLWPALEKAARGSAGYGEFAPPRQLADAVLACLFNCTRLSSALNCLRFNVNTSHGRNQPSC